MTDFEALVSVFDVELKRGTLSLAILSQLRSPQYGYSLLQSLTDKNVAIEAGTLYPMLRRLEKQGILSSDWDTTESRPRKYYALNDMGLKLYEYLKDNWHSLTVQMNALLRETEGK